MGEVEDAMTAANLNEHQKTLLRTGPCGATWLKRISQENAGAASTISPLHSLSVRDELMDYTGCCINVGDGNGGSGGGVSAYQGVHFQNDSRPLSIQFP